MISQGFIQSLVDGLVVFATDLLLPFMIIGFCLGVSLRALVYYTVKREEWFAKEFSRRVNGFLANEHEPGKDYSFYVVFKRLLEKTFYESFIVRAYMKRRRPDAIMSVSDRVFLIQQGSAFLVRDFLKQSKHLKYNNHRPKLIEIIKVVFESNPCFNKVFGVLPIKAFNDVLNILPGLFIIGGIFGTFLGIMKALPELGGMDLSDVEGTKAVMNDFLLKISFSMSTSIIGILISVSMTVFNTVLSPEKLFFNTVNLLENTLDNLWNACSSNDLPKEISEFDEHKDPVEALAEDSIRQEIDGSRLGKRRLEEETATGDRAKSQTVVKEAEKIKTEVDKEEEKAS